MSRHRPSRTGEAGAGQPGAVFSRLYVLTGSHFCELARWALDARGVAVKTVALSPGPHIMYLRRQLPPLRSSQLPVWHTDSALLQGSDQILTHLGYPVEQAAAEAVLNGQIGPLARQAFYAALCSNPGLAKAWMQAAYTTGPGWLAAVVQRAPCWATSALLRREGRRSGDLPQLLHGLAMACESLSTVATAELTALAAATRPVLSRVALMAGALLGPVLVPAPAPWQQAPWSSAALAALVDLQRLPLLQLARAAWGVRQARQAAGRAPGPGELG